MFGSLAQCIPLREFSSLQSRKQYKFTFRECTLQVSQKHVSVVQTQHVLANIKHNHDN